MQELFFQFLDRPCCDTFKAVRAELMQDACFDPYSTDLSEADIKLRESDLSSAQEILKSAMPNLLLSPQAHQMLAYIAQRTGQDQLSQIELRIAQACLLGIEATGQGSEDSPFLCCRISDQKDVVRFLGKTMDRCTLHTRGEEQLEEVQCTDGTSVWFDVTQIFKSLKVAC